MKSYHKWNPKNAFNWMTQVHRNKYSTNKIQKAIATNSGVIE